MVIISKSQLRAAKIILLLTATLIMSIAASGARQRENTEWDISYCYNVNDNKLPRVLLIGDSICNGYQAFTRDELAGTAYVSFYATSKCVTDRSYLKMLSYILDEYDYSIIHFNNGLHSLDTDRAEWETGLRAALKLLKEKGKGAKIIWASSTPLNSPALTEKAKELNAIADKVMKENNIPVNDLFALMDPMNRAVYWTDTFHYNNDAKKLQAKKVAGAIHDMLDAKTTSAVSDIRPDVTVSVPANVVNNPGFEDAGGWSLHPPDPSKVSFESAGGNPHSGKMAAKITVKAGGAEFYQQNPALPKGSTCMVKYWARAEKPAKMKAYVRTRKPPYNFYGENTAELGTDWKEYSVEIKVPDDYQADKHVLFFTFSSPGIYWLDDVSITKKE